MPTYQVGNTSRKSGLASISYNGFDLRILILPKFWSRKKSRENNPIEARVNCSLSIVVSEGTVFSIEPSDQAVIQCFEQLVEKSKQKSNHKAGKEHISLVKASTSSPVIKIKVKNDGKKNLGNPLIDLMTDDPVENFKEDGLDAYESYWRAFLNLLNNSIEKLEDLPHLELGDMNAREIQHWDLLPLLEAGFLKEISKVIRHVRPGYIRVKKPSAYIRGRMDLVSCSSVLAGAGSRVICSYDEFGLQTPLLKVIATALDDVAFGTSPTYSTSSENVLSRESIWLRKNLDGVEILPRSVALRIGHSLQNRLSSLDKEWLNGLRLACLVLEGKNLQPMTGTDTAPLSLVGNQPNPFIFEINTEVLWEKIIRKSLGIQKPKPIKSWLDANGKGPDGKYDHQGKIIILDAKYKSLETTPDSQDQHQAFVYSVLFDADKVLLVYPKNESNKTINSHRSKYSRNNTKLTLKNCDLVCIEIQFPKPVDLENQDTWNRYLEYIKLEIFDKIK